MGTGRRKGMPMPPPSVICAEDTLSFFNPGVGGFVGCLVEEYLNEQSVSQRGSNLNPRGSGAGDKDGDYYRR